MHFLVFVLLTTTHDEEQCEKNECDKKEKKKTKYTQEKGVFEYYTRRAHPTAYTVKKYN